jgi:hypothetical protein
LYPCLICIVTVGLGRPANLFSRWAQKYVQPALFKHLRIGLLYVRKGFTNYEALHCLSLCPPVGFHLSKYLYYPQRSLKFGMKMNSKHVSILSIQYFLSTNNCKEEYEELVVYVRTALRKKGQFTYARPPFQQDDGDDKFT